MPLNLELNLLSAETQPHQRLLSSANQQNHPRTVAQHPRPLHRHSPLLRPHHSPKLRRLLPHSQRQRDRSARLRNQTCSDRSRSQTLERLKRKQLHPQQLTPALLRRLLPSRLVPQREYSHNSTHTKLRIHAFAVPHPLLRPFSESLRSSLQPTRLLRPSPPPPPRASLSELRLLKPARTQHRHRQLLPLPRRLVGSSTLPNPPRHPLRLRLDRTYPVSSTVARN